MHRSRPQPRPLAASATRRRLRARRAALEARRGRRAAAQLVPRDPNWYHRSRFCVILISRPEGARSLAVSTFRRFVFIAILAVAGAAWLGVPSSAARAQNVPSVQAILFWSKDCEHCHTVIQDILPGLQARYGAQLDLTMVEISSVQGHDLWQRAWEVFGVPEERHGIPMLIVGNKVMLGELEIPAQAPPEIDRGLAAGGLPLAPALGVNADLLRQVAQQSKAMLTATPLPTADAGTPAAEGTGAAAAAEGTGAAAVAGTPAAEGAGAAAVARTPAAEGAGAAAAAETATSNGALANVLAWLVFVAMFASVAYSVYTVARAHYGPAPGRAAKPQAWRLGLMAALAVVGIVVAGYLSYHDVTMTTGFCPVGSCSQVQASQYARIMGIPVAVLGLGSYIAVLVLLAASRLASGALGRWSLVAVYAVGAVGTLFSIYLTSLELFVIKAVCMWCLMSAVAITCIATLALRPALTAATAARSGRSRRPAAAGAQGRPRTRPAKPAPPPAGTVTESVTTPDGKSRRKKRRR
jgi:uncharacterized membrane protein